MTEPQAEARVEPRAQAWLRILPDEPPAAAPARAVEGVPEPDDPAQLILTCANCGAAMDERKCKLICRCGYFLSCSDYY